MKMRNTNVFASGKFRFTLGKKISSGGNGNVYNAIILDDSPEIHEDVVVKFLHIEYSKPKKWEKRYKRFKREVDEVRKLQTETLAVIPIIDAYLPEEMPSSKYGAWYMMPKAEQYDYYKRNPLQRINDVLQIGYTLRFLHSKGICHRDLKPENILWYKNKPCLTDFGLVRNIDNDIHLTEDGESIGSVKTRPPEFEEIDLDALAGYDYRIGDIYMFGKTAWMILHGSETVFPGSYNDDIGLVQLADIFKGVTLTPLRELFLGSTQHQFTKRISIDECIECIETQIRLIQGDIEQVDIFRYKIYENIRKEINIGSGYSCTEIDKSKIRELLHSNYKYLNMDIIPYGRDKEDSLIKGEFCLSEYQDNTDGTISLQIMGNTSLRFLPQSITIYNKRGNVVYSVIVNDVPVNGNENLYSFNSFITNHLGDKHYVLQTSHTLIFSIKTD